MKRLMSISVIATATLMGGIAIGADASNELFPPAAKPGECYTRVFVPPTYKTTTDDVMSREASTKLAIVPATYETVEETVLVREESVKLEVVPAVYGWVEEQILVKPETTKLVEVPAVYETVTEQLLVKAAHTAWKEGRGPIEKLDNSTGEIMCLVEVPAEYKTVTKRVLKSAARTEPQLIPAVYETVKRRVVTTPATTREVKIPAKYDTVRVRKIAKEASSVTTEIPAQYTTVTRREKVTEGRMDWRQILCETNTTPGVVSKIQRALDSAGFSPGPIDGVIGAETLSAVREYQVAKGLPKGGLTVETLQALGIL